jgi:hypothetical protein
MLDLALNLLPDKQILLNSGVVSNYPTQQQHPLPDSNTRLVSISESDLAVILAFLDESMVDYVPLVVSVGENRNRWIAYPKPFNRDLSIGEVVPFGTVGLTIRYVGSVDTFDRYPLTADRSRALLRERVAIIRERLMVDLTAYMTRIAEALEGIEVEVGDATSALERVATAVESQTTSEGLDDIASAVGALAPLVALI